MVLGMCFRGSASSDTGDITAVLPKSLKGYDGVAIGAGIPRDFINGFSVQKRALGGGGKKLDNFPIYDSLGYTESIIRLFSTKEAE